jgi:hypothetical protein
MAAGRYIVMAGWWYAAKGSWWYTVMVGEGRPSTFFLCAVAEDVDGRPSPTMTGGRRPEAMT